MQPIGGWSLAAPSGRAQAQLVTCAERGVTAAVCALKCGFLHILWRSEKPELQGSNGVTVVRTPCKVTSIHGFWDGGCMRVLFGGEDAKLYTVSVVVEQLPQPRAVCREVVVTRATQLSSSLEQRQQAQAQPIQRLLVHERVCFLVEGGSLLVLQMNHDFTAGLLKQKLPFADVKELSVEMTLIFREQGYT